VPASVGRFSFFCENRPVLVLSWCYENLIGSLIYILFLGWWVPVRLLHFFVFSNPKPRELWEPDLSSMREPFRFSEIYMYTFELVLICGSRSCENLRLVIKFKSVDRFSLWEPGWEPGWESGQHLRTAQHWCLHLLIFSDFFY